MQQTARRGTALWLLLLPLFLVVLGARLWLIANNSTPLPFWDQWDAEGATLLKPWLENHLGLGAFFAAHNEHRIVLTRLLALLLFIVNGQWDAQLEMAANVFLVATTAAAIGAALFRIFPGRQQVAIALMLALLFALPFGWENTLAGFQSAFYFLLLFSLVALWGMTMCAPFSAGWWIGAGSIGLACLSMASGFLVAAALILFRILTFIFRRERVKLGHLAGAAICALFIVIGLTSRVVVPGHAVLKAESTTIFIVEVARCLAWPLVKLPWFACVMQAPLLLISYRYFFAPSEQCDDAARGRVELLLTSGLWIWLQTAAIAIARGTQALPPTSRYQDLLALSALVNFLCATILLSPRVLSARNFLGAPWMVCFLVGLAQLSVRNFTKDLPARRHSLLAEARNVSGYVATGDYSRYLAGKKRADIPYPDPQILANLLNDPTIRNILPYNVRRPRVIESLGRNDPSLPRSVKEIGRCTRTLRSLLRGGKFFFLAGCIGLILGLFRLRARSEWATGQEGTMLGQARSGTYN